MQSEVYLGLGSNLGDKRGHIQRAVERLREVSTGLTVSSFYETAPVAVTLQPPFVNAVCGLWTRLSVFELLTELRDIQREAGVRGPVLNGPRALDIDILLYGSLVVDLPHLTVPHPRMTEREFVLRPLAEIAPGVVHPVMKKTAAEMLADLDGNSQRTPRPCPTGYRPSPV
ncbi:MAG: 2-amino-4-hydroxy-6-hydroxymethyldihydropteridine diphosphokinase [Chloroflexota bacterium]|nr:2-amino-4-hydroxy-6-hydroxymethyldihydropteridine diphosphokinase [Chloroflexota bacterium]